MRSPVIFRIAALLLVASGLALAYGQFVESDDTMMVDAQFKDVSPLLEGNDVRIDGVRVGTIDKMKVVDGGAKVTFELQPEALPLYQDASVTSRPVSLLGERYVDLSPGTPKAGELEDGTMINEASSSTDLDQVLNMMDKPTSESLAALVTTLGVGLDGNGKNVSAAIRALAPAMRDTKAMTKVLREQNEVLADLVESFEPVAAGLAVDEGRAMDALVDSSQRVLQATAVNEAAFRKMLRELPSTLAAARKTLGELEGTANAAVPTLEALQPTTRDLSTLTDELARFADSANPALKSANPVLKKAERLVENAAPIAEQLRLSAGDINADAKALNPITRNLSKDMTSVMEFFRGWALTTNGRDGLTHYFRANLIASLYTGTGLLPLGGGALPDTGGDVSGAEKSEKSKAPTKQAQPKQNKSSAPQQSESLTEGQSSLLAPSKTADGGVTGLGSNQEQNFLSFLFGGKS